MPGNKTHGKSEKANETESKFEQATCCSLSGMPLCEPIVCCELGYLYNKEEVLKVLLEFGALEEPFSHIRLKELVPCVLTKATVDKTAAPSKSASKSDTSNYWDESTSKNQVQWVCPLSMVAMTGHHPFCVLHPSGKVLSEKAVKEVPDIVQGQRLIPLYPSEAVRAEKLQELQTIRRKGKSEKKRARCKDGILHSSKRTKPQTKNPTVAPYIGSMVKQVAASASDIVAKAKSKGCESYTEIFADDTLDNAEKMFIGGNTRGYERC